MLEMFQNQTMRYISIAIGVISIFIFLYLLKLGEGLVISLMVAVFICGLSLLKLKNYYEMSQKQLEKEAEFTKKKIGTKNKIYY